jgi:hypothetical protein
VSGWVPWEGGPSPPVDPHDVVEVRFKVGTEDVGPAWTFRWTHEGWDGDIIAYREANALDMPDGGE